jgi:hypothetical protein
MGKTKKIFLKPHLRDHHPPNLMVWAGVSWKGVTNLVFVKQGVKVKSANYLKEILIPNMKPLTNTMFDNNSWTFQQDSAPAHRSKVVQKWLSKEIPNFITHEEWPPNSPDLNSLDYFMWSRLESMVCSKRFTSVNDLESALKTAWDNFPMEEVRESIDHWILRLKVCVRANGGDTLRHNSFFVIFV